MKVLLTLLAVALAAGVAQAQQNVTVQNLLAQDYVAVGSIASPIGPGVFLQKKDKMYLCFVVETPQSATVKTRYCKPVE